MRDALKYLLGSLTTYVLVAACSAASDGGGMRGAVGGASVGVGGAAVGSGASAQGAGGMMGTILDPVPDADAAESGTRLKVIYESSADGLKVATAGRYFDSEKNMECSALMTTEAKLRCLPASGPQLLFSDKDCAAPVALFTGSCVEVPALVSMFDYNTAICGAARYEAYSVGATHTGSVYSKSGTNCVDMTASYASYTKHSATKLPASDFAEITTSHE